MKKCLMTYHLVLLIVGVFLVGPAVSLPINQVDYSSLTGTGLITFDDIAGGPSPGTNYDSTFESGGALFGEHFLGQTLSYSGSFDVISGSPSGAPIITLIRLSPNSA